MTPAREPFSAYSNKMYKNPFASDPGGVPFLFTRRVEKHNLDTILFFLFFFYSPLDVLLSITTNTKHVFLHPHLSRDSRKKKTRVNN